MKSDRPVIEQVLRLELHKMQNKVKTLRVFSRSGQNRAFRLTIKNDSYKTKNRNGFFQAA